MTSKHDGPGFEQRGTTPGAPQPVAHAATSGNTFRDDVAAREKEQFGGMKFGAAFFGWLTATGAAVLLTALALALVPPSASELKPIPTRRLMRRPRMWQPSASLGPLP